MCNEQVVYCQHPKCGHVTAHAQAPPIGNPAEPCDALTKFLCELQRPVCPDDLPPFPCAALPVWRIPFDEYCPACLAARRPCLRSAAPKEVGETVANADDTRHSRGSKRGDKEPLELEVRALMFGISIPLKQIGSSRQAPMISQNGSNKSRLR